jgi:hypothetical protein
MFYVHSGLSYSAYDLTSSTTMSLSATDGTTVVVTTSAAYFSADDIGQRIRAIDSNGVTKGELEITAYTSSTNVVGEVKTEFSVTDYAVSLWGLSVSSISGLDHLEAETVKVLLDGGTDKPDKTVSNGTITLSNDGFVASIGLGYTQTIKTLPQEAGAQRGTAQGKIQRITEAAFKLNRSHRGFEVGGSSDELETVSFRDPSTLMGTAETLYTGTLANIPIRNDYTYGSQLIISNSDPLPIELMSLITTIDTQEKT